jgi:hypothetical protein
MTKAELFIKIEELLESSSKEALLQMIFDFWSTDDLQEFYTHLKDEFEYE